MKNLIAATYAPMHDDGSLNLDVIKRYGAFLKSNHIAGAFVNGSTGDFASMSIDERKQLVEAWAGNRPNDFRLICHVGHSNLREAKEMASHAVGKVDAIAALAPYYFRPRKLERLIDYCREIALSAPNLPFYYYHIPALTGAGFPMIDFLKLASTQIPNFAGIKYTHNNLEDFDKCKRYKNAAFEMLFGVDEQLLSSLPYGADGWVGSTYNHLAPLYHEIMTSFEAGNMKKASELQGKAVFFVETLDGLGGFNGAGKGFMKYLGIDCGPSRYPHCSLTDLQLSHAAQAFHKAGIVQYMCKEPDAPKCTS